MIPLYILLFNIKKVNKYNSSDYKVCLAYLAGYDRLHK